jgi:hypothetical protein
MTVYFVERADVGSSGRTFVWITLVTDLKAASGSRHATSCRVGPVESRTSRKSGQEEMQNWNLFQQPRTRQIQHIQNLLIL